MLTRVVILSATIALFIGVNAESVFTNPNYAKLAQGFGGSVLATIFALLFFDWKNSNRLTKIEESIRVLSVNGDGINSIRRNSDYDKSFWIDSIRCINSNPDDFILFGNRLHRWRSVSEYKDALFTLLSARQTQAENDSYNDAWKTYICVTNNHAQTLWEKDIQENLKWKNSKIKIIVVPKEKATYSAIITGTEVIVTPYTHTGSVEDSVTFSVSAHSLIGRLYRKDMIDVLKNNPQGKGGEVIEEANNAIH